MKEIKVSINPKFVVWTIAIGLIVLFVSALREVVVIFFLAYIVSAGVRPLVDRLQRGAGIPRILSLLTVYSIAAFFIILVLFLTIDTFIAQFNNVTKDLPSITRNVLESAQEAVPPEWGFLDDAMIDKAVEEVESLKAADATTLGDVFNYFSINFKSLGDASLNIITGVTNVLFSAFIVIMVAGYLIAREDDVYHGVIDYIPKKNRAQAKRIFDKVETGLGEWVVGQMTLMLIIGVLSYIVLMIPYVIGIESYGLYSFALLLAIICGINEGFPNIGPTLSIVIASLLALGTGSSFAVILYIFVSFSVIQQLEALFITPLVMKRAVDVDPIVIILALIAGFKLGSVLGAILSIPVVVIIKIILKELNENRKKHEDDDENGKGYLDEDEVQLSFFDRGRLLFRKLF